MPPILCYYKAPPGPIVESRSAWVKARVDLALSSGLKPALLPAVGLERQTIAIPADMLAKVRAMAEEAGVAPGRMVGMLAAAVDEVAAPAAPEAVVESLSGDRPEQIRLLAAALPLLDAGRVVLMEAGTGVGKSRLAARIAQHFVGGGKSDGPVVVATPSVAQLCHLVREIQALREHPSGADIPAPAVLLGRSNFVDVELALEYAEAAGHEAAREWIAAGAPAGLTDSTRALAEIIPVARGLMDDWLHILGSEPAADPAIDFSVDDVILTEDSSEDCQRCYVGLRADAFDRPLVLCTHAMLGSDAIARRRGQDGLLPIPSCLVVDEAHQLEQEVANVASHKVSLWSLSMLLRREKWTALRAGKSAEEARVLVDQCIAAMARLPMGPSQSVRVSGDQEGLPYAFTRAWAVCVDHLSAAHAALSVVSSKLSKSNLPGWRNAQIQVQRSARAIEMTISGEFAVDVSHSAVRKLSSLTVGPRTVGYLLRPLWDRVGSAALLSATMYVPTYTGETSFYISQILSLPVERTSQTKSEHPQWVTMSPTVMLPEGKELVSRLTPPTKDAVDLESLSTWLGAVAEVVSGAARSAAGGTLVLLSSYERLQILAGHLDHLHRSDRLVVQSSTKGVTRCEAEFRSLAKAGKRPVWLATGGAWTGLDLRDKDVADGAEDLLLTDLVIPNLPLGLNKSTTHSTRKERFLPFEGMSMALLFRQGLGRLIRRPGLLHRRIWMLDGRLLVRAAASSGSLYSPCLMMLDRFRKTMRFKLPMA